MSGDLNRIWQDELHRVSYVEHDNGDVSLIVSTKGEHGWIGDNVRLPAAVIPAMSSTFLGISWRVAFREMAANLHKATAPDRFDNVRNGVTGDNT